MKRSLLALGLLTLGTSLAAPTPLTLKASDGVTVYAQSATVPNSKGVILLFHQARSNMHEYDTIVQKLALQGYSTLAIDQRSGGSMFGADNQTARAVDSADYVDALPDLEAALAWAKTRYPNTKIYALGSSYSAMLLFPLAEKHPELSGIMAFSPGDYSGDGLAPKAAKNVTVPVFSTSSGNSDEQATMDTVIKEVKNTKVTRFQPAKSGVHGASTLRDDRNIAGSAPEYWKALLGFLKSN